MQNSFCVLGMTVAFMSLYIRGRTQQQGGNNQTASHFEIDSEKSQEKNYKSRPASTLLKRTETAGREFTQIIWIDREQ